MRLGMLVLVLAGVMGNGWAQEPVAAQGAASSRQMVVAERRASDGERVYSLGKGVRPPVLLSSADPEFPKAYRNRRGFESVCGADVVVGSDGKLADIKIVHSLGPEFDRNAIAALEKYRFKPAARNGEPVAVKLHVQITFRE